MEYKYDFYWGTEPTGVVLSSMILLKPYFSVLDLGCGEGRNSFVLAKRVSSLTAVDISCDALSKVVRYSQEKNLNIKTHQSDAYHFIKNAEIYDSIYCINLLQMLNQDKVMDVIKLIKDKTSYLGLNVIHSFIAGNNEAKKDAVSKDRYLFDKDELKSIYKDWKILHYKEFMGKFETHNQKLHRHFNVELIAQKI